MIELIINALLITIILIIYLALIGKPRFTRILVVATLINSYAIYPIYAYMTNDGLYAYGDSSRFIVSGGLVFIYYFLALFVLSDCLVVAFKRKSKQRI
jgi:hypothetical protein